MTNVKRQKKLAVLLPLLVGVSVLVWMPNFTSGRDDGSLKKRNVDIEKSLPLLQDVMREVSNMTKNEERDDSLSLDWGRNPFMLESLVTTNDNVQDSIVSTGNQTDENSGGIVVKGIFYHPDKPVVLINNEIFGVGSDIGDYKVVKITKDTVTISFGDTKKDFKVQE